MARSVDVLHASLRTTTRAPHTCTTTTLLLLQIGSDIRTYQHCVGLQGFCSVCKAQRCCTPATTPSSYAPLQIKSAFRRLRSLFEQLSSPPHCTIMSSFWADACSHANSKPLQALLDAAHGSCGTTVNCCCPSINCFSLLLILTLLRADRCVLHERARERRHVLSVAACWGGGAAALVAAVRVVQRAHAVRQLRRRGDVDGLDAGRR